MTERRKNTISIRTLCFLLMSIEVKYPEPHNIYAMKRMWQICFKDTDEYIQSFFEQCFQPQRALVAFYDLKPAGMLFMLPAAFMVDGVSYKGNYLYAVCTKPEFQGKGIMRMLERKAQEETLQTGGVFTCLVPQTSSLFKMYEKIGYKTAFYLGERDAVAFPSEHIEGIHIEECKKEAFLDLRKIYLSEKSAYVDFEEDIQMFRFDEFQRAGGKINLVYIEERQYYVAGYLEKSTYIIKETSLDNDTLKSVLPLIAYENDAAFLKIRGIKGRVDNIKPYGMVKWLDQTKNTVEIKGLSPYMNMMLD